MRTFPALLLIGAGFSAKAQVVVTGAMRNTMFNGQLAGLIGMDSLARPGMYGLGPLDHLRGEVMLWDGVPFTSHATSDSTMSVVIDRMASAPFFVHAPVTGWMEVPIPDSITHLPQLDAFLTARYAGEGRPLAFTLSGRVAHAEIHVMDLPPGSVVRSPDDAHQGRKTHVRNVIDADLLGFFSTRHKAVFTHHDTNIHMHLISKDRAWMGHVDALAFDPRSVRLQVAIR